MQRKTLRRTALVAGALIAVGGTTAAAVAGSASPEAAISQDQAVAAATAVEPGEVLEVELDDEPGFAAYEVEIAAGDIVVEVLVDAGTGEVIGREVDDDAEPDDD